MRFLLPLLLVACGGSASSPVVVGHVESGLVRKGELQIEVNGDSRRVVVDRGGTFIVEDLPTGELFLRFETEAVTGEIVLHDVQPYERIDVEVGGDQRSLAIQVVRREVIVPDKDDDRDSDSDRADDTTFTVTFDDG